MTSSVSATEYQLFDNLGRMTQMAQITDGHTYTSKYTYNFSGALVEEEYPSGRKVKNEFESDGDISRIYGNATPTATERTYANTFSYTPDGRIEKLRLGNGLWEKAKFNSRLQVTEMAVGNGVESGNLWKLGYEYGEIDGNGNVDTAKNTGNVARQTLSFHGLTHPFVQTYKYDSLYRLTEARETSNSAQTWKQNFSFDRYGNRLTHDKFAGTTQLSLSVPEHPTIETATNRLSAGQGFTFDANGNLIIDADGRQFTFNGDNKQTEVTDAQNNVIGQYHYDGEGKRIKKVSATETTVFVYSAGKLIAEYSTATPSNPTTSWTVTDQLGSPRVIVNSLGQVVSRRDFMPFGEELDADETFRKSLDKYGQTDSVRQKFTGYQNDTETGLDFAEARMYQDLHGRFTAVDPLLASGKSVNPQTFNRYVYVINNPIILIDPDGQQVAMVPGGRWYQPKEPDGEKRYRFEITQPDGYEPVTERDYWGRLIGSFAGGMVGDQRYFVLAFDERGPLKALTTTDMRSGKNGRYQLTEDERNGFSIVKGPDFKWTGAVETAITPLDVALFATPFKGVGGGSRFLPRPSAEAAKSTTKFWSRSTFEGTRVYQRGDLFDPNLVSSWKEAGKTVTGTNLERMASGRAPIGYDGESVVLHHMLQTNSSPLAEMSTTFHRANSSVIHINPNSFGSGINRPVFDAFRSRYWAERVRQLSAQ